MQVVVEALSTIETLVRQEAVEQEAVEQEELQIKMAVLAVPIQEVVAAADQEEFQRWTVGLGVREL